MITLLFDPAAWAPLLTLTVLANILGAMITQSAILDIVFKSDSVLSDVGIADHLPVMITAVAIAILVMVGVALVADGLHRHFERSIIYAAMAFSGAIEALYLWQTKRANRHAPPTDSP